VHLPRTLRTLIAAGFLVLLGACQDKPAGSAPQAAAGSAPVSIDAIAAEAKGFNVGSAMSTRTVYVFFDPQCPHCAVLWQSARPLKPQARFVWIPVALLNDKSAPQGAALLSAGDPQSTMDQHEASITAKQGGIGAMGVTDEQKAWVQQNTKLFNRFGFGSVPTVVAKHAQSGELVTIEGALPPAALAQRLGLTAPN
jgi:thiol:disulfide interchange protein DsbG